MKLLAVYTTVATQQEARTLARIVVERKLAACAQISPIESFYRWKGEVRNDAEHRILFKVHEARYQALEAAIREMHPYELPAIHAVGVEAVYEPYAAWVEENCSDR